MGLRFEKIYKDLNIGYLRFGVKICLSITGSHSSLPKAFDPP